MGAWPPFTPSRASGVRFRAAQSIGAASRSLAGALPHRDCRQAGGDAVAVEPKRAVVAPHLGIQVER
jgi:hypothetical protein